MTSAQFLIDTSALARFMRPGAESFGWDQAVTAGPVAVCPITELEFFYSARSAKNREDAIAELFGLPLLHHDRDFATARSRHPAVRYDAEQAGESRVAGADR